MSEVRVRMQKDGCLIARAEVGSRVFLAQGPTLHAQLELEPTRVPICVGEEVKKAVQFASEQDRRCRP